MIGFSKLCEFAHLQLEVIHSRVSRLSSKMSVQMLSELNTFVLVKWRQSLFVSRSIRLLSAACMSSESFFFLNKTGQKVPRAGCTGQLSVKVLFLLKFFMHFQAPSEMSSSTQGLLNIDRSVWCRARKGQQSLLWICCLFILSLVWWGDKDKCPLGTSLPTVHSSFCDYVHCSIPVFVVQRKRLLTFIHFGFSFNFLKWKEHECLLLNCPLSWNDFELFLFSAHPEISKITLAWQRFCVKSTVHNIRVRDICCLFLFGCLILLCGNFLAKYRLDKDKLQKSCHSVISAFF